MKVIEREFLSEVSGAGGRNDPSFNSGRNNTSSKGGAGSQNKGNPNYIQSGVVSCNNGIIGGAIAGAAGGLAGAALGVAGGAFAGGCFGGSGNGGSNSGSNNSSGNCNSGGMGGSCNR